MCEISIITVSYNNVSGLIETVESCLQQTFKKWELIVVDNESIDGTQEYLSGLEDNRIISICEKDRGIYDAMNKGILNSTGKSLVFMNSGDCFFSKDILQSISLYDFENLMIFGKAMLLTADGSCLYPTFDMKNDKSVKKWLKIKVPTHQAMFFPRNFCVLNLYDMRFKICADYLFKKNAFKQISYVAIDDVLCKFQLGGVSTVVDTYGKLWAHSVERFLIEIKILNIYSPIILLRTNVVLHFKYILFKLNSSKALRIIQILSRKVN